MNKYFLPVVLVMVFGCMAVSCDKDPMFLEGVYNYSSSGLMESNVKQNGEPIKDQDGNLTFTVNGVTFKMIYVKGGTFPMGATSEQGSDAYINETPVHRVTLSDYYIGETEVTQALWKAVMGSNPSCFKGDNLPVESVSYNDIVNEFLPKLNQLTGKTFRLPTEAEWEYAARGGGSAMSWGYKYSGGNSIDTVAWYSNNSDSITHAVGMKKPNELGLYDMSGNVWEWCSDWYGSYGSGAQTNPGGPSSGSDRVLRGGSWSYSARSCRVSFRFINYAPNYRNNNGGFRLSIVHSSNNGTSIIDSSNNGTSITDSSNNGTSIIDSSNNGTSITDSLNNGTFIIDSSINGLLMFKMKGVMFTMVAVSGGTFQMGGTSEQGGDASGSEKPVHSVTLSDYYIGEMEVSQALWKAVMGSNPSYFTGDNLPVENVRYNEIVNEFLPKLNRLTGKIFRLPTEAEWEYASRGGSKSKGYKYSGSNTISDVAWYDDNSGHKTHTVGTRQPNELGLYDMSGNVWEWCSDWIGSYGSGTQTNPKGPVSGSDRVYRGGSYFYGAYYCRVSNRLCDVPHYRDDDLGFRLAMDK